MEDYLRASEKGLQIIKDAGRKKGWKQTTTLEWWRRANTTQATLKRFWQRKRIDGSAFRGICEAVGVNWKQVAELSQNQETELPVVSTTMETPCLSNLSFVGRENAIASLNTLIRQGSKIILIQAAGGIGKTTLAEQFLHTQGFELVLELRMAKEKENIRSVESVIEGWLKQDLEEEPGRDLWVSLERLKRQLQTRKIGVLIDNLEPALDGQGKFIEPHRNYVELLRMLTHPTVQSGTLITSRERLCEPDITVERYVLPGLDEKAWQQFFTERHINIDMLTLKAMHKVYGGNAKAMGILCGAIREDFGGDMIAYWQENSCDPLIETDLKNLVTSQFNRLQGLDLNAYKLLCRLGCYRYQDMPAVPIKGLLCLLWDVPEGEKRLVIKSLQNRSLVEFNKGEYWLHPLIRAEAISRLKESGNWENAHRKAAEKWLSNKYEIKSWEDGMRICEAFHHYCSIIDWPSAFKLLETPVSFGDPSIKIRQQLRFWGYSQYLIDTLNSLKGRLLNMADEGQRVGIIGASLYSIGDYTQSIQYLEQAKELFKSTSIYYYAHTISWLGKAHAKLGNISLALIYCHQALEEVNKLKGIDEDDGGCEYKTLNIIGDIYFILAEYEIAIKHYQKVLMLSQQTGRRYLRDEGDAFALIACCQMELGNPREAINNIKQSIKIFQNIQDYTSQCIAQYFLCDFYLLEDDLGKAAKVLELTNFLENKIKYFDPGMKRYRLKTQACFNRYNKDFNQAISLHEESIKINHEIGAKCDLADSYYQLGLTYQEMGDISKSLENFNNAIRLFREMEAPKQVEKVRQAIDKTGEI
ncbi:tetratricopeptide repeat protein [Ancylothrix sp. C2]|uniref:tetratricopeptide repeat protein n=1 Tax=Ancylothrix sp. D3o TaxID=2953691 RepID=UPI0021BA833B|nr:tetratricopeptide repeat protein [Ancylothrix sp. D3o]MCT7953007.1 tetratricopeptide repeat protein [Ancylothrix sp. D3o]